ncbi:hypothetical protein CIHG_08165 [Coccidioides immitis H538.4]|uniref:Uncharacterized protein n=3 Tax=Coccidioides immitis TaxID=5501 RepID=A0A0J8RC14_COCIT|nr:hypothetical protein CIRG_04236 [Coccidioides immitis RMSCC 2394]KMU81970.1 hypothetical protein CISG_09431 [Coccidioides immitis RMSCC 3703]KMU90355.1 hypothetical protein CIHG_08165 [Coccidioides immitis H538.4]
MFVCLKCHGGGESPPFLGDMGKVDDNWPRVEESSVPRSEKRATGLPREHLGECGGRFSAPLAEPPKSTPRSMWFCLLHLVSDLQGLVHFLGKFEVKSEVESISVWMRRLTRMPDYAARGPNLVRKNVDGLRFKHFVHAHTQNRTSSECIQAKPFAAANSSFRLRCWDL